MKKFVLALALVLLLTACGGTETTTTEATPEPVAQETPTVEDPVEEETVAEEATEEPVEEVEEEPVEETPAAPEEKEIGMGEAITLEDSEMVITGAEVVTGSEDEEILKITVNWTNKTEDTTSAMATTYIKAFQGGSEIERAHDYTVINSDQEMAEARPDSTVEGLEFGFILKDMSPVEIDFEDFLAFDGDTVTVTIDPSAI